MKSLLIVLFCFPAALFAGAPEGLGGERSSYLCEDVKKPLFRKEKDPSGAVRMAPNRAGLQAASFLLPKPRGRRRVFVVGESVAGILGAAADVQGKYLPGPAAAADLEIINCGMGAYDSSRLLPVLKEILAYEPDLVILLSGNNE